LRRRPGSPSPRLASGVGERRARAVLLRAVGSALNASARWRARRALGGAPLGEARRRPHGHVSGAVGQAPGAGASFARNSPRPPGFGGLVPESCVTVPPKFVHSTVGPLLNTTPTLPCDASPRR